MIDQAYLKSLLIYDPCTGAFIRCKPRGNNAKVGALVGCKDVHGYLVVRIDGKLYKLHRLAWLYMTGAMPSEVDHLNRKRDDNRWCNLREVDSSQNSHNIGVPKHNKSGHLGVSWDSKNSKWKAQITVNGKRINLGRFRYIGDAVSAREAAERRLHPSKPRRVDTNS